MKMTALELFKDHKSHLSFGCPIIDDITGGLSRSGITEIVGDAGCGKTQLCLGLALMCTEGIELGGLDGVAAYLRCGSESNPIARLQELSVEKSKVTGKSPDSYVNDIMFMDCTSIDDLANALKHEFPELCVKELEKDKPVRLLLIDSIAALVRTEYNATMGSEMHERTQKLYEVASQLKWISHQYGVSIVVVNQVTGSGFDGEQEAFIGSTWGDLYTGLPPTAQRLMPIHGSIPALGYTWSHCVDTRIRLNPAFGGVSTASLHEPLQDIISDSNSNERVNQGPSMAQQVSSVVFEETYAPRKIFQLRVEFSPRVPDCTCTYKIMRSGVQGLSKIL